MLSYGIVYAFQKYGSFGAMGRQAMLREIAYYAVAVVGLSATVNFGLVTVLKDYDSTLDKYAAVAVAAVAAGLVAWFVSTRILRIGGADFRQVAKQLTVRRPPFDLRFGSTLDHALMTPQPFKRSVIH